MPSFKFFSLSPYAKFRNYKPKKKKNKHKAKREKKRVITKTEYQRYLESDYWRNIRTQVINKQKHCVFCNSRSSLNVHHNRYYRRGKNYINNENLDNLFLLCRICHEAIHKLPQRVIIKQSIIDKVKRLIHINKLTNAQAINSLLTH